MVEHRWCWWWWQLWWRTMRNFRDWCDCVILLDQNWIIWCRICAGWQRIWSIRCGRPWWQFHVLLWWCLILNKKINPVSINNLHQSDINQDQQMKCISYRACLRPCIIVNHLCIASWRHCTWFGICRLSIRIRSGRHEKSLTNVTDNFTLIFWIFMWWPRHVAVWECWWQWWRWVCIHTNCLIFFVLQISEVKIFIVIAFWSVNMKLEKLH